MHQQVINAIKQCFPAPVGKALFDLLDTNEKLAEAKASNQPESATHLAELVAELHNAIYPLKI